MLAPHAAAPASPSTSGVASLAVATPVRQRTQTPKPTKRLPARELTPRQRRSPRGAKGSITAVVLQRQVMEAINVGTLGLDAGNALLTSMNYRPLKGAGQVAFRVDARLRTPYDGLGMMIGYARAVIVDELRQLRWTRLDGCPEGYGIDEPGVDGERGLLCGTVHTTMRVTVSVPAYPEHALEATAIDLLHRDLAMLHRVQPEPARITAWDEEVTSWDEFGLGEDLDYDDWPAVLG